MWDFSWYTQAGPGEPFADLDRAFAETVERGFNTVRICAMPFLLFSGRVHAPESIQVRGLGEQFGQRTRWYDVRGGYPLDGRRRLVELFEAAARHDCKVIVSSWEYQQSPSFADTDAWHRALAAVPGPDRAEAVAESLAELLDFLTGRGLADHVAYVEVHNEVDNCDLVPADGTPGHYARLRGPLERAVKLLRARHPDIPVTYSLGEPWPDELDDLPEQAQIAHFHFYVYGVLGALYEVVGLGHGTESAPETATWPTPNWPPCCAPTRPPSPTTSRTSPGGWPPPAFRANCSTPTTGSTPTAGTCGSTRTIRRTDRPCGRPWPDGSTRSPSSPAAAASPPSSAKASWATPLLTRFEEDAVGKDIAEFVVDSCLAAGFQGVLLTSNAAPHHPMWHTDADWMRRVNSRITAD